MHNLCRIEQEHSTIAPNNLSVDILTPLRNHAKQVVDEMLVYSVNKIQSYHRQPQQARVSLLREVQRGLQMS